MILTSGFVGNDTTYVLRDLFGEFEVDVIQDLSIGLKYHRVVTVGKLERYS